MGDIAFLTALVAVAIVFVLGARYLRRRNLLRNQTVSALTVDFQNQVSTLATRKSKSDRVSSATATEEQMGYRTTPSDTVKSLDISRSDLNGIERGLERILTALDRGPGGDLQAIVNRLEDIRSLLRDISGKLDRR